MEHLHPLLARELGGDFRLERALAHGTLPGIYAEHDPGLREQVLRSYVDAYLREEVQAEALVRDIGGYSRLLDLVAASSGRLKRRIVVFLGSRRQKAGEAEALPLELFLDELPA